VGFQAFLEAETYFQMACVILNEIVGTTIFVEIGKILLEKN